MSPSVRQPWFSLVRRKRSRREEEKDRGGRIGGMSLKEREREDKDTGGEGRERRRDEEKG